jgi:hypothetical protein
MTIPNFIDQNATFQKFGYFPSTLSETSNKLVVFKCEFCKQESITRFNRAKGTCKGCNSLSTAYTIQKSHENKSEFMNSIYAQNAIHLIDIPETIKQKGFDPTKTRLFSAKRVIAICEFCSTKYETSLNTLNKRHGASCKECHGIAALYITNSIKETKHEFYRSYHEKIQKLKITTISHINISRTIEKFGYDPTSLKWHSHKKIIAKCHYCESEISPSMIYFIKQHYEVTCNKCIGKKTVKTMQTKYGVSSTLNIPSVKEKLKHPMTEQMIESLLRDKYKIEFIPQYEIGPYTFDFYVPSINLLIECQGDYFHDFKKFGYSGTPKDRAKASYIENNTNHKLVWIWEHEIHLGRMISILNHHIYNMLEPFISFNMKDLEFKKISIEEAHTFLSQYHYLGGLGTSSVCYGATTQNKLICVCSFGTTTRQKSYQKINKLTSNSFKSKEVKELRRFCIKPNANTKNLASYSINQFMHLLQENEPDIKVVLSFSDPTVGHDGKIYSALGWKKLGPTSKSYHYLDPKSKHMIHKKTVYERACKNHMKENEFVNSSGLIKVPEMSKTSWVKIL